MSARLVLVSLAALALFAAADAMSCQQSSRGNTQGTPKTKQLIIPKGKTDSSIDLTDPAQNLCGCLANTKGTSVQICVGSGTAKVILSNTKAGAYRSDTSGDSTATVSFYCV